MTIQAKPLVLNSSPLFAVEAWEEWHRYIRQAKDAIGGPALLHDIHCHAHAERHVELGYLISGQQLDNNDLDPARSSVR